MKGNTWPGAYLPGSLPATERYGGRRRVDDREILSEDEFRLFAQLRDIRQQIAAREAVPRYDRRRLRGTQGCAGGDQFHQSAPGAQAEGEAGFISAGTEASYRRTHPMI